MTQKKQRSTVERCLRRVACLLGTKLTCFIIDMFREFYVKFW